MSETRPQAIGAPKLLEMIDYEIRMLRFCVAWLDEHQAASADDERFLYLECFLLHYRNLIRFFSGNNHKNGDVSMKRPEAFCEALSKEKVAWYRAQVESLDNREDDCEYRVISKMLQHCTETRVDLLGHKWPVSEMYKKIESVLNEFELDCLKRPGVKVAVLGQISNDTVTRSQMRHIGEFPFMSEP